MRKTPFVLAVLLAVAGTCVMLWPVITGYRLQANTDEAVQSFLEERKPEQQYPELLAEMCIRDRDYTFRQLMMQAGMDSIADAGFHCNVCIVEDGTSLLIYVLYDG